MSFSCGDVFLGLDFIGGGPRRPYVILSDSDHPFSSEEAIVTVVTTTERVKAIPLPDKKFESGELPRESFVSPWTVTTLKKSDMREKLGRLRDEAMDEVSAEVKSYI